MTLILQLQVERKPENGFRRLQLEKTWDFVPDYGRFLPCPGQHLEKVDLFGSVNLFQATIWTFDLESHTFL